MFSSISLRGKTKKKKKEENLHFRHTPFSIYFPPLSYRGNVRKVK